MRSRTHAASYRRVKLFGPAAGASLVACLCSLRPSGNAGWLHARLATLSPVQALWAPVDARSVAIARGAWLIAV